ncbi:TetR/AcrR family transcriptional regulator [Pseudomonas cavernicola]|uniref:TetR/AcrR family transcriptional regulator n=1 Tax=Pseudomonas cavernicola TaxID=2320866 RepID=A0A418XI45_9PSED|nr:TetR/AcrR family transcriptional regulator [Pseudomonas cavernicola]RJG12149.1 TetR/AcrR family transcriptional regulator [Pseudomonas cavernicola]
MRKQPTQKRSSEMVVALLDATVLELGERGLDCLTTNHIARRAGASIGSLYQYFDSKEALIEALLQRQAGRLMAVVHQRLRPLLGSDVRTVTRAILQGIFEQVEQDKGLRELVRHRHHLHSSAVFQALEKDMTEVCRQYLMRHVDEYRIDNLPATLFVLINSVQYTTARYFSLEPLLLERDEVIEALTRMVESLCLSWKV